MKKTINTDGNSILNGTDSFELTKISPSEYCATFEDKKYSIIVIQQFDNEIKFLINGQLFEYRLEDLGDKLIKKLGLKDKEISTEISVKSPMPGLIKEVFIQEGDKLKKGDPLLILEAMKMENTLKCPLDELIVTSIRIQKGQSVEKNECLVRFN
jgi:biotin carboxyl carrier protein